MVRIKHRYLLVNILYPDQDVKNTKQPNGSKEHLPYTVQYRRPSSDALNAKLIARIVRDGVADLFGDYGSGMIAGSLMVKYCSPATSTAIIRVARAHYRMVWAALTFTTRLPKPIEQPCVMQVVRVSGTIKKSEKEAIRRARLHIRRAQRLSTGDAGPTAGIFSGPGSTVSRAELDEDADLDMSNGIEDQDEAGEEMDEDG